MTGSRRKDSLKFVVRRGGNQASGGKEGGQGKEVEPPIRTFAALEEGRRRLMA